MRKLILAATAATTILGSSVAYAEDTCAGCFYVKANAGLNKMTDQKWTGATKKYKSKNTFLLGAGVGYYVMDNVRFDLMLDHFFGPEYTQKTSVGSINVNSKIKAKLTSLTVNGYVDLFDLSVAKVFAGAGIGMAQPSGKIDTSLTTNGQTQNYSSKIKKSTNFAYALHLGAATELAPGINGELTYSWRDAGKLKVNGSTSSMKVRGHNVTAGVRFDM